MSPDPVGGSLSNPQSLNRYAYVLNNPLSFTDPVGLDPCGNADGSVGDDGKDSGTDSGILSYNPSGNPCPVTVNVTDTAKLLTDSPQQSTNPTVLAPIGGNSGDTFDPGSLAAGLFGAQGLPYWTAANTTVKYATAGTAIAYGGAFFGPPVVGAGLEYGAQAVGAYQATALGTTGIVLGAYNMNPNYVEEAAERGMNAFNTPNFLYSILNATGNGWTANQAFLDRGIASGQTFYLSSAPYVTGGFGYLSEILYLAGSGVLTVPLP